MSTGRRLVAVSRISGGAGFREDRTVRTSGGTPVEAPLIAGKLTLPVVRAGTVVRDRLTRLLAGAERLVVVVAPAGWGKTTLLAHCPPGGRRRQQRRRMVDGRRRG
jgi:hypothetical protein